MITEQIELNDFDTRTAGGYFDGLIDAEELLSHLEQGSPFNRREFCEFIGIGESTLSGWLKDKRIPRVAKVAFGLLLAFEKQRVEMAQLQADQLLPLVVDTGHGYQICKVERNEHGDLVGEVVAENIKTFNDAYRLASAERSLKLLKWADEAVQYALDRTENEPFMASMEALREQAREHRLKSVNYLEGTRVLREAEEEKERLFNELLSELDGFDPGEAGKPQQIATDSTQPRKDS